jgi:hypothetical protein
VFVVLWVLKKNCIKFRTGRKKGKKGEKGRKKKKGEKEDVKEKR